MKVTIDLAHREYFQNQGYIQFEELLTQEQIEKLQLEIDAVLAKRGTENDQLLIGHDLWRSSRDFSKLLKQRNLASLASELLLYKPLRLGYDQYITSPLPLKSEASLAEVSCIQGIMCGLLICLNDSEIEKDTEEEDEEESGFFPTKAGDGTYFLDDFKVPWDQIEPNQNFLLIVYTQERALYIRQDNDPHQHLYKDYGYAYGDRLKDQWHPIVYQ